MFLDTPGRRTRGSVKLGTDFNLKLQVSRGIATKNTRSKLLRKLEVITTGAKALLQPVENVKTVDVATRCHFKRLEQRKKIFFSKGAVSIVVDARYIIERQGDI